MLYVILSIAALLTSALSAVTGLGGGVLMLAVILAFLPFGEAVPLHAAVQLSSNATRVAVFLKEVDWKAMSRFVMGLIPGGVIGTLLLIQLGQRREFEPYMNIVVGVYVLIATFLPRPKGGRTVENLTGFVVTGLVAGSLALMLGAIGPLVAPVVVRAGYDKQKTIATQAICQMLTHLIKFPAFILGFGERYDYARLGLLAVILMVMAIPGTLIGKSLLKHVPPHLFNLLFRGALFVAGGKVLIFDGVLKLMHAKT